MYNGVNDVVGVVNIFVYGVIFRDVLSFMAKAEVKFAAVLGIRIEPAAMEKFVANAEACKSTKDIVLRELVYAFNRSCEGGRFPVLQRLEIASPGYMVSEDGQHLYDASTAPQSMAAESQALYAAASALLPAEILSQAGEHAAKHKLKMPELTAKLIRKFVHDEAANLAEIKLMHESAKKHAKK
jgi:hypothetical protein